jgi:hypothetical protein
MSLAVDTGRNNNRDITWLENDNSIEIPLSPVTSESSTTSNDCSSSQETSYESSDVENQIVSRYVPPSPLSENETINPVILGSINNIIHNCNTSVVPFSDNTNSIVGTISHELQQFDLDCPICFDPLDTSVIITMDCCKKQLHLNCIKQWHVTNIDSQTQELCIMCRTNSSLMADIYNTVSLTIHDNDEEEQVSHPIIVRRRRRRRRRGRRGMGCDGKYQHAVCAAIFIFSAFLFVLLLNNAHNDNNDGLPQFNRTLRYP